MNADIISVVMNKYPDPITMKGIRPVRTIMNECPEPLATEIEVMNSNTHFTPDLEVSNLAEPQVEVSSPASVKQDQHTLKMVQNDIKLAHANLKQLIIKEYLLKEKLHEI